MKPIFFGMTRSFWLAMATVALMLEQGEPLVHSIASLAALALPWTADSITQWIMDMGPLVTFLLAMHQRSGASRPYTIDPRQVQ